MLEGYAECETIVRRDDPDRAVAVAFAPKGKRAYLGALYAFELETARVRQIVSQPLPGEIRLQWWRDRIEAHTADPLEASGQGSPVAQALLDTIATFDLPAEAFVNLLNARIFDLYDDPMPSRTELEGYAGETASAIMMLAAMVLDRAVAPQASEVAGHTGIAAVAANAMRLLRSRPAQAQIFFPSDILDAVGCTRESLQAGDAAATGRALAAMAAFGREHVAAARRGLAGLPKSLRPAFLMLELLDRDLRQLEAGASDRARAPTRSGSLARLFAFWRAMRR